jgi:hypothetical protein
VKNPVLPDPWRHDELHETKTGETLAIVTALAAAAGAVLLAVIVAAVLLRRPPGPAGIDPAPAARSGATAA